VEDHVAVVGRPPRGRVSRVIGTLPRGGFHDDSLIYYPGPPQAPVARTRSASPSCRRVRRVSARRTPRSVAVAALEVHPPEACVLGYGARGCASMGAATGTVVIETRCLAAIPTLSDAESLQKRESLDMQLEYARRWAQLRAIASPKRR
jgi:hypothetical protein